MKCPACGHVHQKNTMITRRQVNAALAKAGAKETITKTGDIWHFTGGQSSSWKFSVKKLSITSISEWVDTWRTLNKT